MSKLTRDDIRNIERQLQTIEAIDFEAERLIEKAADRDTVTKWGQGFRASVGPNLLTSFADVSLGDMLMHTVLCELAEQRDSMVLDLEDRVKVPSRLWSEVVREKS